MAPLQIMKLGVWWLFRPFGWAPPSQAVRAHLPGGARFAMLRRGNRDHVADIIRAHGWAAFEPPMPRLFAACLTRTPGLVIDVGANTGFYALTAAALATAASSIHVLAFEPDAAVLRALRGNIRLNRAGRRITLSATALSDHAGAGTLYVPSQAHGLIETSSSLDPAFIPAHSAERTVPLQTLDAFLAASRFANTPVTVMKIDVEGHEVPVLAGARVTIARFRPILFVEVLRRANLPALSTFIAALDYADIPLLDAAPLAAQAAVTFSDDSLNHAFVPRENVNAFLSLAETSERPA